MSSDEIRKLLSEHGYNWDRASELALRIGEKYARRGHSIAIDSDCASKTEEMRKLAEKVGAQIMWIHVNPPEEFIIHKLTNYPHTWLFKDGDDALRNYYARKQLHEKLNLPFAYVFDTSRDDLPQQIAEAEHIIHSNLQNTASTSV